MHIISVAEPEPAFRKWSQSQGWEFASFFFYKKERIAHSLFLKEGIALFAPFKRAIHSLLFFIKAKPKSPVFSFPDS